MTIERLSERQRQELQDIESTKPLRQVLTGIALGVGAIMVIVVAIYILIF
jgi:hypothetical protein